MTSWTRAIGILGLAACAGRVDIGSTGNGAAAPAPDGDAAASDAGAPPPPALADAGVSAPPGCSPSGLCWVHPQPTGEDVVGVYAPSDEEAWAVTEPGTLLRFRDRAWAVERPAEKALRAFDILGSGADDVWITARSTGSTSRMHYDGQRWTHERAYQGPHFTLWGTRADGWYAFGQGGSQLDPAYGWRPMGGRADMTDEGLTGAAVSAWGTSASDVFVLDRDGQLYHFDGRAFRRIDDPLALRPGVVRVGVGVIGVGARDAGPRDVWVATEELFEDAAPGAPCPVRLRVRRWDGAAWTDAASTQESCVADHGLYRFRGERFHAGRRLAFEGDALLVASKLTTNLLRVRSGGAEVVDADAGVVSLASSPRRTWAVGWRGLLAEVERGGRLLVHSRGSMEKSVARTWGGLTDASWAHQVIDLATPAPGSAFALLYGGEVLHVTGAGVTRIPSPRSSPAGIDAISASSVNDVWVAGIGMVARWDGRAWQRWTGATEAWTTHVQGIWARTKTDVWAVGLHGAVARFDGSAWQRVPGMPEIACPMDVSGTGPDDVWIVGNDRFEAGSCVGEVSVHHWNGARLEDRSVEARRVAGGMWLGHVAAVPGGRAWFVGDTALEWDGSRFVDHPTPFHVKAAWASGPDDVWLGGDSEALGTTNERVVRSRLVRWDGRRMAETTAPPPGSGIRALSGSGPSDVWAGGDGEMLLRTQGPGTTTPL